MGKNKAKNAGTKNQQNPAKKKSAGNAMKNAMEKAIPDLNKVYNGTVKWFNTIKGYGFIIVEDGTEYFFHQSNITKGRKMVLQDLHTDDAVSFKLFNTEKGISAVDVCLLDTPKATADTSEKEEESADVENDSEPADAAPEDGE